MGIYDKIQKSFPVTKSELTLVIIVLSGLIVANICSAFFEDNITQEEKQELIEHFDSLLVAQ